MPWISLNSYVPCIAHARHISKRACVLHSIRETETWPGMYCTELMPVNLAWHVVCIAHAWDSISVSLSYAWQMCVSAAHVLCIPHEDQAATMPQLSFLEYILIGMYFFRVCMYVGCTHVQSNHFYFRSFLIPLISNFAGESKGKPW